jgi:hypothetical protein
VPRFREIINYTDMTHREAMTLQKGMNFLEGRPYSIILMSVRKGAPYQDKWHEERGLLEYKGHDAPQARGRPKPGHVRIPKRADQPLAMPTGSVTENGRFFQAADDFKAGAKPARIVQVYEKIATGIWCDRGKHELVDAEIKAVPATRKKTRNVCRFYLRPAVGLRLDREEERELTISRQIPTAVKVEVYRRDQGRCVECGATDNLHYDHDFPFSKGGTSMTAANVRLLCMRHNLSKGDKIVTLGPLLGPLVGAVVAQLVRGA